MDSEKAEALLNTVEAQFQAVNVLGPAVLKMVEDALPAYNIRIISRVSNVRRWKLPQTCGIMNVALSRNFTEKIVSLHVKADINITHFNMPDLTG